MEGGRREGLGGREEGGRGRERGSINFIPGRQKLKYSFLTEALSLVSSIVDFEINA